MNTCKRILTQANTHAHMTPAYTHMHTHTYTHTHTREQVAGLLKSKHAAKYGRGM